jgi:hypothetical protein
VAPPSRTHGRRALVLGDWTVSEAATLALLRAGFSLCLFGTFEFLEREEHPVLDVAEHEEKAFVLSTSLYEIGSHPELALAEASEKLGDVNRVLLTDWNGIRWQDAAGAWLSTLHGAGGGELVVLHSDQHLVWTLRWKRERAASRVRVRAVAAPKRPLDHVARRFGGTTITGALLSMGYRRVTTDQIADLAAQRVASGADVLAQRLWTSSGGSIAGSPGFCSPEGVGRWLRPSELQPGEARAVCRQDVCDYTALGIPFVAVGESSDGDDWHVQAILAEGPIDAVRLSGSGDIFDFDGAWRVVGELDLSAGRVWVCDSDSPDAWDWAWSDFNDYRIERWPIDITVHPGRYVVEFLAASPEGYEDLPGLRIRLLP